MVAVFQRKSDKPPIGPRVKSYSAASGYVYEYSFVGQREHGLEMEYLFDISYDRRTNHRISIWVSERALEPWCAANQRELRSNERYAIAKIALRNAFDERPTPEAMHQRIAPGAEEVILILEELDV